MNTLYPEKMAHGLTRFKNGTILFNHQFQAGDLWTEGGKVISVGANETRKPDQEIDVGGMKIAPGLIDIQLNGGFGLDFTTDLGAATQVAQKLVSHGVTAFLPTLITADPSQYRKVLPTLQKEIGPVPGGATILGIHLEGPFISLSQAGAHPKARIQDIRQTESLAAFFGSLEGVKIITLAPEEQGALEWVAKLSKQGMIVSIGHSEANSEVLQIAKSKGAKLVTHLFNAMPRFHHRSPGIIGTTLGDRNFSYSVIADGIHLDPTALRLAWNAHPEGLILVTDAIAALGLNPGQYKLGEINVEVQSDRAVLPGTSTLAGSVISLDSAVRYFRQSTSCTDAAAWEAASFKPAQLLGIEKNKGQLVNGSDADFVLLDDRLRVRATYVAGELLWKSD